MATATITKPAAKGGSFLLESPLPQDVFTPADLTDDQKLIGQTAEEFVDQGSDAAGEGPGEQEGRVDGGVGAEGRGARNYEWRDSRAVWRGGSGQDRDDGFDGETIDLWRVRGYARSACGDWDAAYCLFRNGGAEEKVSAEAGVRGNDWGVLFVGAAGRFGCTEFVDAG